eukprot:1801068-Karenia_brevis.AAC.1
MAQWDYANVTGWRHQHSGRRLHWEDPLDVSLPRWRDTVEEGGGAWKSKRDSTIEAICRQYNLN